MAKPANTPVLENEAQEYDSFMENAERPEDLHILDYLKPLKACKVVDLGCGPGNYTYRIAQRVGPKGRVIGVDPDSERIKIASGKWVRDNLTFLIGDGENYPDDQYDIIFSRYTMHWIEDKRATFEKAYRSLRPGGQFAFVTTRGFITITEEVSALMGPEGHQAIKDQWHFISTQKYKEIATSIGFEVDLIKEDFDDYVFENVDAFVANWYGITATKFDPSNAIQSELEKFKQKYAGRKLELKQPVVQMIFSKNY